MTALTTGRDTPGFPGYAFGPMMNYQLNPGSVIYTGGLVGLNSSGLLVPMTATTGLKCVGAAWNQYGSLPPDLGQFTNTQKTAIGTKGLDTTTFYGASASLGSLTVILTVDGHASTTTFSGTLASKAALLTALNTQINTDCSTSNVVYATQHGGGGLLITGSTSVVVGAGTANTLLGLPTGSGDVLIQVRRGIQFFNNSATAPCLVTDLYGPVYAEDDNTCCTTVAGHSPVGILYGIVDGLKVGDTQYGPGVWVDAGAPCIAYGSITAPTGVILTAPTATGQVLTATSATAAHFA